MAQLNSTFELIHLCAYNRGSRVNLNQFTTFTPWRQHISMTRRCLQCVCCVVRSVNMFIACCVFVRRFISAVARHIYDAVNGNKCYCKITVKSSHNHCVILQSGWKYFPIQGCLMSERAFLCLKVQMLHHFVPLVTVTCWRRWVWCIGQMVQTGENQNWSLKQIWIVCKDSIRTAQ